MYAILHRVADGIMVDLEPQWDDGELEGQLVCREQVFLTRMLVRGWDGMAEADGEASNKFVDKNDLASASIEQLQECEDTDSLCSTLVQVRGEGGGLPRSERVSGMLTHLLALFFRGCRKSSPSPAMTG